MFEVRKSETEAEAIIWGGWSWWVKSDTGGNGMWREERGEVGVTFAVFPGLVSGLYFTYYFTAARLAA